MAPYTPYHAGTVLTHARLTVVRCAAWCTVSRVHEVHVWRGLRPDKGSSKPVQCSGMDLTLSTKSHAASHRVVPYEQPTTSDAHA